MITAAMVILIAICGIRTISYGIYVVKESVLGGMSVFMLALLSLCAIMVCFR